MVMSAADFAHQLDAHRGYLMRVALLQLRDRALAEDVVQETMLAALDSGSFSGRSSLRTWLTGILKHKIVDAIRRRQREPVAASTLDEEGDIEDFDALFKAVSGAWDVPPADWGDPEQALGRREFFDALELCLERLPPNTARVFVMREVMELDSDEICRELAITTNNLWVILYRARMSLRECLGQSWFGSGASRPRPSIA
jgi:RNA polymerase sigma-70 factor (ECF subfamily)